LHFFHVRLVFLFLLLLLIPDLFFE